MRPKDDLSLTDRGSILRTLVLSALLPELRDCHHTAGESTHTSCVPFSPASCCLSCPSSILDEKAVLIVSTQEIRLVSGVIVGSVGAVR